jgi:surface antigen
MEMVMSGSWRDHRDVEPDPDLLVRLMRYLDDDLNSFERQKLEADLENNPDLQSHLADIRRGTDIARNSYMARNNVVRSRSFTGAKRNALVDSKIWNSQGYRQAAAIIVGICIGVLGSRLDLTHRADQSGLHLAGLPSSDNTEDSTQRALATALVPLLTGTSTEVAVNDEAAGLHGRVNFVRHFSLSTGVPCTEFSFAAETSNRPRIVGIACQNLDGSWQTMTVAPNS